MSTIAISTSELAAAKYTAKTFIDQQGVEGAAKPYIESLVTSYEAVKKATGNHAISLYIAAQEVLHTAKEKPVAGKYTVPQHPRAVLEGVQKTAGHVLGYCISMKNALEHVVREQASCDAISVGVRTYLLKSPKEHVHLVGLEKEQRELSGYMHQLYMYSPETMKNIDKGRFPSVLLYTGPPGTGKSSLLLYAEEIGRHLASQTGKPFHMRQFGAANFSKWLGGSSRALKRIIDAAYDPAGIGVFAMEDIDMLLSKRGEGESAGTQHVQQYLMNVLSGSTTSQLGNVLHIFTTNKPESLDEALFSRTVAQRYINPFTDVAAHAAYFQQSFPHLSQDEIRSLAQQSLEATFTGRDLFSIKTSALALTTRPPTLAEILDTSFDHTKRFGIIPANLVEALIAERKAFRHN